MESNVTREDIIYKIKQNKNSNHDVFISVYSALITTKDTMILNNS